MTIHPSFHPFICPLIQLCTVQPSPEMSPRQVLLTPSPGVILARPPTCLTAAGSTTVTILFPDTLFDSL